MATAPHAGLGTDIFNSIAPPNSGSTITSHGSARDVESDDESASTSSSASSVVVALASATLVDSLWQSAPSYPPQYLSTISEPIHPSSKPPDRLTAGDVNADGLNPEGHPWASEKYENSIHMDPLFDRFNERTAREPQQCVRCALPYLRGNRSFSDATTCIGTTSAVFLCRLLQMSYPNDYFHCLQRVLLPRLSQKLLSMPRIHSRSLYSTQHPSLPVHIAVLAAYSNISSCQI